jgi:hypothetical protein
MRRHRFYLCLAVVVILFAPHIFGQAASGEVCPRGTIGSAVQEPEDLRSQNGVLKVEFSYRTVVDAQSLTQYCWRTSGFDAFYCGSLNFTVIWV